MADQVNTSPPVGVAAAVNAAKDPAKPYRPAIFEGFSLKDRVAVVSGGNRGLGLEMALALAEAGARVYALDLPEVPGEDFQAAQRAVEGFGTGAKLEYVKGGVDVTNQKLVWDTVEKIGDAEGRVDIGVAAAGIAAVGPALEITAEELQKVINVNTNGVLYTAQAVGRQMERFKLRGSIVLIASMAGSVSLKGSRATIYCTSKGAVVQMARSLACELGPKGIRVNSLSPGYINTALIAPVVQHSPETYADWCSQNPLGRIGRPDEVRGVVTWLASDASSYCNGSDIVMDGGHRAW